MRCYVAGSFNTINDIEKVLKVQEGLRRAGVEVLNQLEPFDYRRLYNFIDERELAERIVKHDLSLLEKTDVVIALADRPSFGTGAEVFYSKRVLGKKVIAVVSQPARSPWIVIHADIVVRSVEEAISAVKRLSKESTYAGRP